MAVLTINVWKK